MLDPWNSYFGFSFQIEKDWEYKKKELTREEIKIIGEQVVIMVDRFPFSRLGETSTLDVQIDVKMENTEFLGNV